APGRTPAAPRAGSRARSGAGSRALLAPGSLPGQGVLGRGGGLLRAPPVLVVAVPVDGGGQAGGEVGELRGPAQLGAQAGGVDRVAQVVPGPVGDVLVVARGAAHDLQHELDHLLDRKSTRLNSSHVSISYAVFCLKKKKTI